MWSYLKTVQKPIVLYGMGNGADKVLAQLQRLQIPVQGVFASDGFVRGHQFHGFDVLSYTQAVELFGDMVVLLCFGSQRPEVLELFRRLDLQQELYAPDMPIAGEGLFDTAYYHAHQAELEFVRSRLADAQSRLVFDCVVQYKLSGKIAPLFACQTPVEEAYGAILKLCNHERFLDLGAYSGDTIEQFLQHVQGYEALYAVEPDPKNFAKLQKRTSRLSNCYLYQVGIHSEPGQLPFCVRAGRNSQLGSGGTLIEVESVDHLLDGRPVTYLKLDVEGQESAALKGAAETIGRYHPKLLVSCYHRTEDLFALPIQVLELCPDYKLYLRHHPYVPAWDTNYYFVHTSQ